MITFTSEYEFDQFLLLVWTNHVSFLCGITLLYVYSTDDIMITLTPEYEFDQFLLLVSTNNVSFLCDITLLHVYSTDDIMIIWVWIWSIPCIGFNQ